MKFSNLKSKLNKTMEDNKNLKNSLNSLEYRNQVYNIISGDGDIENGISSSKSNFYNETSEKKLKSNNNECLYINNI